MAELTEALAGQMAEVRDVTAAMTESAILDGIALGAANVFARLDPYFARLRQAPRGERPTITIDTTMSEPATKKPGARGGSRKAAAS